MEKKTHAGMKAGAVTGFLFPFISTLLFITFENAAFNFLMNYLSAAMAKGGLRLPPSFIISMVIGGQLLLGILCAALGAGLGIVFVKITGNLPFQSVYANALLFSMMMFIIFSLLYLPRSRFPFNYLLSVVFMLDAVIFAFLFNNWTKT